MAVAHLDENEFDGGGERVLWQYPFSLQFSLSPMIHRPPRVSGPKGSGVRPRSHPLAEAPPRSTTINLPLTLKGKEEHPSPSKVRRRRRRGRTRGEEEKSARRRRQQPHQVIDGRPAPDGRWGMQIHTTPKAIEAKRKKKRARSRGAAVEPPRGSAPLPNGPRQNRGGFGISSSRMRSTNQAAETREGPRLNLQQRPLRNGGGGRGGGGGSCRCCISPPPLSPPSAFVPFLPPLHRIIFEDLHVVGVKYSSTEKEEKTAQRLKYS